MNYYHCEGPVVNSSYRDVVNHTPDGRRIVYIPKPPDYNYKGGESGGLPNATRKICKALCDIKTHADIDEHDTFERIKTNGISLKSEEYISDLLKYRDYIIACNNELIHIMNNTLNLSFQTRMHVYGLYRRLMESLAYVNTEYVEICTQMQFAFEDGMYVAPKLSDGEHQSSPVLPYNKQIRDGKPLPSALLKRSPPQPSSQQSASSSNMNNCSMLPLYTRDRKRDAHLPPKGKYIPPCEYNMTHEEEEEPKKDECPTIPPSTPKTIVLDDDHPIEAYMSPIASKSSSARIPQAPKKDITRTIPRSVLFLNTENNIALKRLFEELSDDNEDEDESENDGEPMKKKSKSN